MKISYTVNLVWLKRTNNDHKMHKTVLRNSSVNFGIVTVRLTMEPRNNFGIATVSVHLVKSFFYLVITNNASHIFGCKMTYIIL